jgi:regulator of sigma E protease
MNTIITIILLILLLGILVFIHELGHFLVAKAIGTKVLEFALGFGPKLISKKYKGTVYSIRILPLGGFVQILGEGDDNKPNPNDKGNLKNKSRFAQACVMLAGVTMNILLAITCYFVVIGFSNWKIPISYELEDFKPVGASITKERVGDVPYESLEDGNAFLSELPKEGTIKRIDGKYIEYSKDISQSITPDKVIEVEACNTEDLCGIYFVEADSEGKIGIAIGYNFFLNLDYSEYRVFTGFSHLINNVRIIGRVLGSMFREARETGDYSDLSNSVSGPVGMFFLVDYFKSLGLIPVISLIGDLSLSLAIMNILPIPALDGGRVFILLIEAIFKKDLDPKVERLIINISFIFLIILIVLVMIKDIVNIEVLKSFFE